MNALSFAKISYLDGIRYSRAVLAGCQEVISHEKELNKINVFPIPDRDTGSNLKKTFQSIDSRILSEEGSLNKSSQMIAELVESWTLGYSGTIFAEFFSGFAEGVKDFKKISIIDFSRVMTEAVVRVYQSFEKPVEGTALSVMKAWTESIRESVSDTDDFYVLLKRSHKKTVSALESTPDQLKVLKKNGVVDAGAKAFVYFLKGIIDFIEKGTLISVSNEVRDVAQGLKLKEEEEQEKFCVECCVRSDPLDRMNLVKELYSIGRDLIFYSSINFAKIHIRTQSPKEILSCVSEFGDISSERIWDCSKSLPFKKKKPLAIVSDTTCDISEEYVENNDIYFVPVKFHAENKVFTDRVNIIPEEFYDILKSSSEIPKTSKPSMKDFMKVYRNLLLHYRAVLSIHLSSALSGTFQTALQAAKNIDPQRIRVLDSKNLSVGLGLIVWEAMRLLKRGMDLQSVLKKVEQAIQNIEIFIGIPTMKYLVKGGRITKTKGLLARIFHINPILSLDTKGSLIPIGKVMGRKKLEEKILSLVFTAMKKNKEHEKGFFFTAVAHINALNLGERIREGIAQKTNKNPVMVLNASPVLGAHSGPGTTGVAVLRTDFI